MIKIVVPDTDRWALYLSPYAASGKDAVRAWRLWTPEGTKTWWALSRQGGHKGPSVVDCLCGPARSLHSTISLRRLAYDRPLPPANVVRRLHIPVGVRSARDSGASRATRACNDVRVSLPQAVAHSDNLPESLTFNRLAEHHQAGGFVLENRLSLERAGGAASESRTSSSSFLPTPTTSKQWERARIGVSATLERRLMPVTQRLAPTPRRGFPSHLLLRIHTPRSAKLVVGRNL